MTAGDVLGWSAAGLALLTSSMRSMIALRTVAVARSVRFIAYGARGTPYPACWRCTSFFPATWSGFVGCAVVDPERSLAPGRMISMSLGHAPVCLSCGILTAPKC